MRAISAKAGTRTAPRRDSATTAVNAPLRAMDLNAGLSAWCERRDSNPHALRHWHLKPGRLPIPPLSQCPGILPASRSSPPMKNARREPGVWGVVGCEGFEPSTY